MVSVLVPTFDWDVVTLCENLHAQFLATGVTFELLISENCPKSPHVAKNQTLNNLPFCQYLIEGVEVGRSANRNALAKKAQYNYLLFLDGDTALPDADFANRYVAALEKAPVICGGTQYVTQAPTNPKKILRWLYGQTKEQVAVNQRQQATYRYYSSFNFLIEKDLFFQIGFDGNLKQYGHEDTLFGRQLKKRAVPVLHIANPLLHLGLDDATDFLDKTKAGVENLYNLGCTGSIDAEVRLHAWYQQILSLSLTTVLAWVFRQTSKKITDNLTGPQPKIWLFDFYKLGYLCTLHEKHQGLPTFKSR